MTAKKPVTAPLHAQARTQVQTRLSLHPVWRWHQHGGQERRGWHQLLGFQTPEGEKVIVLIDNQGYVRSPLPRTPVNKADTVFPEGLTALKRWAKLTGLVLNGSYLNLDGGFDSTHNRRVIFNAGLIPNIPENPCDRNSTQCGIHETDNDNAKE